MPKGNFLTLTYKKRKKGNRRVQSDSKNIVKYSEKCNFCLSSKDKEEELGKMIKKNGFTVHYFCLLFASGLCQRGRTDREGIFGFLSKDIDKELNRGLRLKCEYCKEVGATIGCVVKTCRKKFHFNCGKENGSLHQFFDTFKSFCPEHRPKQLNLLSSKGKTKIVCPICMSNITNICDINTMKSSCCKNSWFHRNCMQRYSLSAGLHFFKCPMCNDKNKFQQEMLEFGIYIPNQDASWETEPNAFNELLERHNTCDAKSCSCPMGRNHDSKSGRWELILCDYCGSQGSHVGCYGLHSVKKGDKICQECWESCETEETEEKEKTKLSPKSKKPPSNFVTLTDAQEKRRNKELQKRYNSDRTVVRITEGETDAEIDVEDKSDEDDDDSYPLCSLLPDQTRKRRRLALNRSRRSSSNTSTGVVSANITVSNDSCKHRVTATMSSASSSSITLASSSSASAFFPNISRELPDDDSEPETYEISSDSSDNYSIQDITDLPDHKSLTITWRGKKIHISNPAEKDPEKIEDWTVQLQVSDSGDSEDSESSKMFLPRKKRSRLCNAPNDEVLRIDCDSPPILVPVDEDISIKCFSPRSNNNLNAPRFSPKVGYNEMGVSQTLPNKYNSRNINRMTRAAQHGEKNLIPSISASSVTHSIQPSSSINSIISISSSDSDSADTQLTKVRRTKYTRRNQDVSNLQFENYGLNDLKDMEDLASSIQLLPRNTQQSRVVMEPEVVILD